MIDAAMLAALLISFAGGLVFGVAGFGFALVTVTPLLQIYDPPTVVALTILLSIVSSVVVVVGAHEHIDRRTVLAMTPPAIAGLVAGAQLLRVLDSETVTVIASGVVLIFTFTLMTGLTLPGAESTSAAGVSGALSGLLATSTGLSGPPAVMLLTARQLAPLPFRVTISAYFLCINLVGIVLLTAQGSFGVSQAEISAMLLPAAGGGTLAGRWLARHISIGGFRRVVLLLLVITGVIGIATALPDMLA